MTKLKLSTLAILSLTAFAPLAHAEDFPPGPDGKQVVATADEPIHHVILENKYFRVMRVMIPPGEQTMWHEQHLDYVNTHIIGSPVRIEYIGGKPTYDGQMVSGTVSFGDHGGKPETDRVTNTGTGVNHQIAFEIKQNGPLHFPSVDRTNVKGFTLVLDKPSIRGWHVKLAPGEGTGEYTQKGPGVRVIFSGNRLLSKPRGTTLAAQETIQPADAFLLTPETRTIYNGGTTTLEFNEYELR